MSTSSSSAYPTASAHARAITPQIAALSLGSSSSATAADSEEASRIIRLMTYDRAITVTDLVNTIPHNYRERLAPELRFLADIAEKRVAAQSSIRKLESAIADDKPPSHLTLKVPELQACKEFREGGGLAQGNKAIADNVAAAQAAVMKSALAAKQAEVNHLDVLMERESMYKRFSDPANTRWEELRERSLIPTFKSTDEKDKGKAAAASIPKDATGIKLDRWIMNPAVVVEYHHLLEDIWPIALRCISIVELRDYAMQAKFEKKQKSEKSADIEMADATKAGPSIQSLVDKAVAGRVKPLQAQVQKLSVKGGKSARKPQAGGKKKTSPSASSSKSSVTGKKTPAKTNKPRVSGKGKGKGKA
ncbi:hypothetical protein TRAPUB_13479, partial [Trametes pubescens]